MFSGIVESVQPILSISPEPGLLRVKIARPKDYQDLKIGDSIAVNGACLTLESQTDQELGFALAAESLRILELQTSERQQQWVKSRVNLERSLRFGDRVHGHLVTGHVESLGELVERWLEGGSLWLQIKVPRHLSKFIWRKGALTVHGVSLTVNDVEGDLVKLCLIPETQVRTNLSDLKVGDAVNLEPDFWAVGLLHQREANP